MRKLHEYVFSERRGAFADTVCHHDRRSAVPVCSKKEGGWSRPQSLSMQRH
jgi:hypothetical protein